MEHVALLKAWLWFLSTAKDPLHPHPLRAWIYWEAVCLASAGQDTASVALKWGCLVTDETAPTRLTFSPLGLGEIHIDADLSPQHKPASTLNCSLRLTWIDGSTFEGWGHNSVTKTRVLWLPGPTRKLKSIWLVGISVVLGFLRA